MLERVDVDAANRNPVYQQFCRDHRRRYAWAGEQLRSVAASPITVVDAACGTGYGCEYLADMGIYIGMDRDESTILAARERYPHVAFWVGDLDCARPFGDIRPDVIVSFETAEHLPNPFNFLGACYAALPAGGLFLFSAPTSLTMDFDPFHRRDWDATRWREALHHVGFAIDFESPMAWQARFTDFLHTIPTTWSQKGQIGAFMLRHPGYLVDRVVNWGLRNRFSWSSHVFRCRKRRFP